MYPTYLNRADLTPLPFNASNCDSNKIKPPLSLSLFVSHELVSHKFTAIWKFAGLSICHPFFFSDVIIGTVTQCSYLPTYLHICLLSIPHSTLFPTSIQPTNTPTHPHTRTFRERHILMNAFSGFQSFRSFFHSAFR